MGVELHLTGQDLTLNDVVEVSNYQESQEGMAHPVTVRLSEKVRPAVEASRLVVEGILDRKETVYGINTGFGALSSVSISPDDVDDLQINLVRSHAAGTGSPLDVSTVRAMMLLRANTLSQGFSGVRPLVIDTLLELLNKGVHPVIPSQGSLGASGDLAPLAHLALVLMGEGEAWFRGKRMSGGKALLEAGIAPLSLKAKEGLALLNGTQMMTAIGALTLYDAQPLMDYADLAGAMTIEAIHGSVRPFDERIFKLRPHPGHGVSAQRIRELLQNSEIIESHRDCAKVQDPYSLRCIPQVHGASRDALEAAKKTITIEMNAVTDNPLIFPDGTVVSQGNFHGQPVSMAMDYLAMALAEMASISERRLDKLMNPVFSGLPAFLVGDAGKEGLNSGFMIVHYTAASLVSENKVLAHPACVDSVPTSNDKEDHVSMGAIAARKARKILDHAYWVIAAELLAAAQGLEFRGTLNPGRGVMKAYTCIRDHVPALKRDRTLAPDVAIVERLMRDGTLWNALGWCMV